MTWTERIEATCRRLAPEVHPFCVVVDVRETAGSTNDLAAGLAQQGAPEGTVVIAAAQTQGRGRRGATWDSPPEAGLYLSVVLRPDEWPVSAYDDGQAGALITIMAGVAVVDALRDAGVLAAELKWPNDVVVPTPGGARPFRKLAGILAEASSSGSGLQHVVLGIGVNISPAGRDGSLGRIAVSMTEAAPGQTPSAEETLVLVLRSLSRERTRLASGDAAAIMDDWRRRAPTSLGWPVSWEDAGRRRVGMTASIDAGGALLVDTAEGRARIVSGTVSTDTEARQA
jgi:BirA family transcriptional regulator, biotin operon repressor / biotin---[acetyl-CoA-carboxylase] ligase